jgi:ketosteroid isomerase-like protein
LPAANLGIYGNSLFVKKGAVLPRTQAVAVATTCLEAWSSGDFATARSLLRDDVTFVGPLGTAGGVEAYMSGLVELAQNVTRAEPRKVLADGADVCIMYDLVTNSAGAVPTSDWYHVEDGKIDSVHAYFDARSLSEAPDSGSAAWHGDGAGRIALPLRLPVLFSAEMEIADGNS